MDRSRDTVDMSSAALVRDALQYVTGVQEALADGRLDHAELDANRAAACLRFLQGRLTAKSEL